MPSCIQGKYHSLYDFRNLPTRICVAITAHKRSSTWSLSRSTSLSITRTLRLRTWAKVRVHPTRWLHSPRSQSSPCPHLPMHCLGPFRSSRRLWHWQSTVITTKPLTTSTADRRHRRPKWATRHRPSTRSTATSVAWLEFPIGPLSNRYNDFSIMITLGIQFHCTAGPQFHWFGFGSFARFKY